MIFSERGLVTRVPVDIEPLTWTVELGGFFII